MPTWDSYALCNTFDQKGVAFLNHLLKTSTEFGEAISEVTSRMNEAREHSERTVADIIGYKPASLLDEEMTHSWNRKKRPIIAFPGSANTFALRKEVSDNDDTYGWISFDCDSCWFPFLPDWMNRYNTLTEINERLNNPIPEEFATSYDTQTSTLKLARQDLATFLASAFAADLNTNHLLFLLPTIKILFNNKQRAKSEDSFKRRPRKGRKILPSITLKQQLAVLAAFSRVSQ
jgi:hypothetical protein